MYIKHIKQCTLNNYLFYYCFSCFITIIVVNYYSYLVYLITNSTATTYAIKTANTIPTSHKVSFLVMFFNLNNIADYGMCIYNSFLKHTITAKSVGVTNKQPIIKSDSLLLTTTNTNHLIILKDIIF